MADWKVIALINGEIEAVSGPGAQGRPGAHEWMVWAGEAADKAEALQSAERADSRVDLEGCAFAMRGILANGRPCKYQVCFQWLPTYSLMLCQLGLSMCKTLKEKHLG
jgi:hypothetical protein